MNRRNWNWKNCNWNWKNVDDVSPFLLFESTGDSEANSDLNVPSLSTYGTMDVMHEVDDAQSCSSNLSGSYYDNSHQDQENMQCSKKKSKKKDQLCPFTKCKKKQQEHAQSSKKKEHAQSSKKKEHEYVKYGGYNPNYRDYNDDEDDEDDGVIDQWPCGKKGFVGSKQKHDKNKSKVSKVEPLKEEEKDKLFWDACLGT